MGTTSHNPVLTIATVVFNARDDFARTLASVRGQKTADVEYLVIDGGSTDGTQELARDAGALLDQFVSEPDSGIYEAMNKAVARARGTGLLFLNAGDTLIDAALPKLIAAARSQNDVTCHAVRICGRGTPRVYIAQRAPVNPDPQHMYWPHPGLVTKLSVFQRVGDFDTSLRYSADLDWTHKVMRTAGLRIGYSDEAVVDFALGGASSTFRSARETRDVALRFGKPAPMVYWRYWKVCVRLWLARRVSSHRVDAPPQA